MTTYKVVFSGKVAPGHTQERVQQAIATLYKLEVRRFDAWFTGETVIVKKQCDYDTARRVKAAFEKTGALCQIESELPPDAPIPDLPMMTCPKCGVQQLQADTCIRCGIVVAKYGKNPNPNKIEHKAATERIENSRTPQQSSLHLANTKASKKDNTLKGKTAHERQNSVNKRPIEELDPQTRIQILSVLGTIGVVILIRFAKPDSLFWLMMLGFFLAAMAVPKIDRRFKTGFKDNAPPNITLFLIGATMGVLSGIFWWIL